MVQQEIVCVNAELRSVTKKNAVRLLRNSGSIPGVAYGKGKNTINLVLSDKELTKQYKLGQLSAHLIELNVSGDKKYAVVRDIQLHVVKDTIQHIDFQFIDKDVEIKVDVPISIINEDKAPGIRSGGIMNALRHAISVKCLPGNIPKIIEIDLSGKMIGQSIHACDIKLPNSVKLANHGDANLTIITISSASSDDDELKKNAV